MLSAAEREEMVASMVRDEHLIVCLDAIERKADIIRMAAAVPPQNQNAKRQAGEIMSLVEQAKKWV
tara:strand:- start:492 stop:689 length:198 start_codon:yes stop_codon:yes gene_type:complete